jgi:hypothetical protein
VAVAALVLVTLFVVRAEAAPGDPPTVTVAVTGVLGQHGWYTSNTWVRWTINADGPYSSSGCDAQLVSTETAGVSFTCTAMNEAGLSSPPLTVTIKVDKSPPAVTVDPDRAADVNGWYNHAFSLSATAIDAMSGPGTCDSALTYSGPDDASADVTMKCRNGAGLEGSTPFPFKYDSTAPSVKAAPARRPDRYGWYSRAVRINFTGQDPVSHVAGCSSTMYGHPNTANAAATGWCEDRAGNRATKTFRFRFSSPLLEPRKGMRVSSPPLLDWVSVPRARGYNAQLWHDGRKILSRWPTGSQLRLDGRWSYQGRMCRLARGESYTWYVWPRFRNGYGKMLGSSRFAFVRSASRAVVGVS